MEDKEPLKTSTLISKSSNPVEHKIHDLLPDGVVSPGIVVGSILLAGHQLLGMEQLTIDASANLIDDSRFQINEDGARDMLASSCLREKGVERIISTSCCFVRGHLAIRLDSMFQTVELPARVTDLAAGLPNVN